MHQSVYPHLPKSGSPLTGQYLCVLLVKESKLDSDFSTILQGFSSGLIDVNSLVGDLTQTSGVASLFINDLLQPMG